jgi:hypothetical protein
MIAIERHCEKVKISIYQLLGFRIPTTGYKRGGDHSASVLQHYQRFRDGLDHRTASLLELLRIPRVLATSYLCPASFSQKRGTLPIW